MKMHQQQIGNFSKVDWVTTCYVAFESWCQHFESLGHEAFDSHVASKLWIKIKATTTQYDKCFEDLQIHTHYHLLSTYCDHMMFPWNSFTEIGSNMGLGKNSLIPITKTDGKTSLMYARLNPILIHMVIQSFTGVESKMAKNSRWESLRC